MRLGLALTSLLRLRLAASANSSVQSIGEEETASAIVVNAVEESSRLRGSSLDENFMDALKRDVDALALQEGLTLDDSLSENVNEENAMSLEDLIVQIKNQVGRLEAASLILEKLYSGHSQLDTIVDTSQEQVKGAMKPIAQVIEYMEVAVEYKDQEQQRRTRRRTESSNKEDSFSHSSQARRRSIQTNRAALPSKTSMRDKAIHQSNRRLVNSYMDSIKQRQAHHAIGQHEDRRRLSTQSKRITAELVVPAGWVGTRNGGACEREDNGFRCPLVSQTEVTTGRDGKVFIHGANGCTLIAHTIQHWAGLMCNSWFKRRSPAQGNSCEKQSLLSASHDQCLQAGISAGGVRDTNNHDTNIDGLRTSGWAHTPCGCFIWTDNNVVHWSTRTTNCGSDLRGEMVCEDTNPWFKRSPAKGNSCEMQSLLSVPKDKCLQAGLSVGGVQDTSDSSYNIDGVRTHYYEKMPSGCFIFTTDNIVYWNTKGIGGNDARSEMVCAGNSCEKSIHFSFQPDVEYTEDQVNACLRPDEDFTVSLPGDQGDQGDQWDMCQQLAKCASKMSHYDLFVYFRSDDIDDTTGTVDDNYVAFDEWDVGKKYDSIHTKAQAVLGGYDSVCPELLRMFHRGIEHDDVLQWSGATVSQVCLAEGTPIYVKLEEAAANAFVWPAYESIKAALQSYVDTKPNSDFTGLDKYITGFTSLNQLVKLFAIEPFQCAEEMFFSTDRTDHQVFQAEQFVFGLNGQSFDKQSTKLRFPNGLDLSENARDEHGQLKGLNIPAFTFVSYQELESEYNTCSQEAKKSSLDIFVTALNELMDRNRCPFGGFVRSPDGNGNFRCGHGWTGVCNESCFAHQCTACIWLSDKSACIWKGYNSNIGSMCDVKRFKPEDYDFDSMPVTATVMEVAESMAITAINTYVEEMKACIEDFFVPVSKGLDLVFGTRTSSGYICGMKEAIVNDKKTIPGRCCLDAPFQLHGVDFGHSYECSMTCSNPGPYFSGLSVESCDAYGGTWCPNPTDCSALQSCIADDKVWATAEQRAAFVQYLGDAPLITNPRDSDECGKTREYFGYDAFFLNDVQICDDIYQLRYSRDFSFLDDFFAQGSGNNNNNDIMNDNVVVPIVPPFEPTAVDTERSGAPPAQNAKAWRSTNFALDNVLGIMDFVIKLASGVHCPTDVPTFTAENICETIKSVISLLLLIVLEACKRIVAISKQTYGELAMGRGAQSKLIATSERIFTLVDDNLQEIGDYMQARSKESMTYYDKEFELLNTKVDNALNNLGGSGRKLELESGLEPTIDTKSKEPGMQDISRQDITTVVKEEVAQMKKEMTETMKTEITEAMKDLKAWLSQKPDMQRA